MLSQTCAFWVIICVQRNMLFLIAIGTVPLFRTFHHQCVVVSVMPFMYVVDSNVGRSTQICFEILLLF